MRHDKRRRRDGEDKYLPVRATIIGIGEQIVFREPFACHPHLVALSPDTVQLVMQVGVPHVPPDALSRGRVLAILRGAGEVSRLRLKTEEETHP